MRRTSLGHLGPGREHRPQLRALERDHVGRLVGDALGDRRLAGERRDVAEERAGVGFGDPHVLARLAVEQRARGRARRRGTARRARPARRASPRPRTSAASPVLGQPLDLLPRTGAGTSPRRRGRGTRRRGAAWVSSARSSWSPRSGSTAHVRGFARMPPFALDAHRRPPRVGVLDQPVRRVRAAAADHRTPGRAHHDVDARRPRHERRAQRRGRRLPARDRARRRRHHPAGAAARDGGPRRGARRQLRAPSASSPTSAAASSAPRWTRSRRGTATVDERTALVATFHTEQPHRVVAFNDVVVARRPGHGNARLRIDVGDDPLLEPQRRRRRDRLADRLDRLHGRRRRPGGRTEPRRDRRHAAGQPGQPAALARARRQRRRARRDRAVERAAQRRDRRAHDRRRCRPSATLEVHAAPRKARLVRTRPRTFYGDLADARS